MACELVLHIGMHKTGTTSLQRFLRENAAEIESRGFQQPVFSKPFRDKGPNRTALFLTYFLEAELGGTVRDRHRKVARAAVRRFKEQARDHDRLLLTDERMSYSGAIRSRFWPALKELLDEAGVERTRFVVYLRRQDQYAASMWNQFLKDTYNTYTLQEYVAQKKMQRVFDYAGWLAHIEEVFGEGCVTVRVFDRASFVGGDIYHDFCDAIGLSADGLAIPETEMNYSLMPEEAEVKRIANGSPLLSSSGRKGDVMRAAVRDATLAHLDSDARRGDGLPKASLLSDSEAADLLGRFAEGNAEVARKYLGREDGVLFAAPKPVGRVWERDADEMLDATIRTFAAALAEQAATLRRQQREIEELERLIASAEADATGPDGASMLSRLARMLHRR